MEERAGALTLGEETVSAATHSKGPFTLRDSTISDSFMTI